MAVRVLIVEDDADINGIVATHLAQAGYTCTQAYSGTEARMLLEEGRRTHAAPASESGPSRHPHTGANPPAPASSVPFDIVICDLMLPGLPGEELVSLIRERNTDVPVIVTSARSAATDKIDLLKLGADDYLTKPFDLDELLVRIEVQLRHRSRQAEADTPYAPGTGSTSPARGNDAGSLAFRSWTLDPSARTFAVNGAEVELPRIDFNIVETLMRHPKRVWTKQELFEQAWGEPYAADDNTVNVHVSNIRAKLKPSGTDSYIKTVWGMGFKLIEE